MNGSGYAMLLQRLAYVALFLSAILGLLQVLLVSVIVAIYALRQCDPSGAAIKVISFFLSS